MPIKKINSEKQENLPFLHRPELFWSMHKSGYIKEQQRRDAIFIERSAADFAVNCLNSGKLNSKFVRLIIQGFYTGRTACITGFSTAGLKIASITDDTRFHKRNIDGYGMQRAKQVQKRKGWSSRIGKFD